MSFARSVYSSRRLNWQPRSPTSTRASAVCCAMANCRHGPRFRHGSRRCDGYCSAAAAAAAAGKRDDSWGDSAPPLLLAQRCVCGGAASPVPSRLRAARPVRPPPKLLRSCVACADRVPSVPVGQPARDSSRNWVKNRHAKRAGRSRAPGRRALDGRAEGEGANGGAAGPHPDPPRERGGSKEPPPVHGGIEGGGVGAGDREGDGKKGRPSTPALQLVGAA